MRKYLSDSAYLAYNQQPTEPLWFCSNWFLHIWTIENQHAALPGYGSGHLENKIKIVNCHFRIWGGAGHLTSYFTEWKTGTS